MNETGMDSKRVPSLFAILGVTLATLAILDLFNGSVSIPFGDAIRALFGLDGANPSHVKILQLFRLPKIASATLAGAALASSGFVLQTVFRNPLAGPDVLGIGSGASIGVAAVVLWSGDKVGAALVSGLGMFGWGGLAVAAALGAAMVLAIISLLARKFDNAVTLLILGLLVGYLTGALVSTMIWFAAPQKIHAYLNWTYGSFGSVTLDQLPAFAAAVAAGFLLLPLSYKPLDSFAMGERYAASVGIDVRAARALAIAAASILTGATTAFCGPIGFLGIAAPQAAKRIFRTQASAIALPASALMGSIFALLADIVTQLPGRGAQLPLNPVLALVGGPIIIAIVVRHARERKDS
jgi:iron complex transport system permease protein